MTVNFESYVVVNDPEALQKAFETFRKETESIVFQRVEGDYFRAPTKHELDQRLDALEDYAQRILATLNDFAVRLSRIEDHLFGDGPEEPTTCTVSFRDSVYQNADIEDGFGERSACSTPCCADCCTCLAKDGVDCTCGWNFLVDDGEAKEEGQAASTSLAGDECTCELCKPRAF